MQSNSINTRIGLVITKLGFNKNSFSKALGLSNNVTIGNIVGGRKNNPSFEVTMKIIDKFPSISVDWLMTGRGEMYRSLPVMSVNIQKRTQKIVDELRKQMSWGAIAEQLNVRESELMMWYNDDLPTCELLVRLSDNGFADIKYLAFGDHKNTPVIKDGKMITKPADGEECHSCKMKDWKIFELQNDLIECLKNK